MGDTTKNQFEWWETMKNQYEWRNHQKGGINFLESRRGDQKGGSQFFQKSWWGITLEDAVHNNSNFFLHLIGKSESFV